MEGLTVECAAFADDAVVVTAVGELAASTAPRVDWELGIARRLTWPPGRVLLDLWAVRFMDAAG